MTDNIVLRKAEATDSEFAYNTRKATIKEYLKMGKGWDEEEQQELHKRRFASQDVRIVQSEGTDIGVVATSQDAGFLKLNQLFLLPDHQGKGIGAECLKRVVEESRAKSRPVRLMVLKVNERAKAFYHKYGFKSIGETDSHFIMEKQYTKE
jgi:ribosomal protein S18 acetylase RimI-like enzyme